MTNLFKAIRNHNKTALVQKMHNDIMANFDGSTLYITKAVIVHKYGKQAGEYFFSLFGSFTNAVWEHENIGNAFMVCA